MTEPAPIIGAPLVWGPGWLAFAIFIVSPGFHLLASPLLERRRVTWKDDYPAVLVGDPLLALSASGGLWLADGDLLWIAGAGGAVAAMLAGWLFGWWQTRVEVRQGRYTRRQAFAPTKLWHQYVVYPVLGYLVTASVMSGFAHAGRAPVIAAFVAAGVLTWAALALDAIRHPRVGHGEFDWRRLRAHPPGV